MTSEVSHFVELYKEVSAIPSVTSATILPGKDDSTLCIHSNWSSQDLVKLEKVSFSRDYVLDCEKSSIVSTGIPYDISSILQQSFSKSGKRQAILREKKSTKNSSSDSIDLEIWNESRKEKTFELTDHEDHGKVNNNAFGCLVWSSNENYLIYTAEAKLPKSSSFFKLSPKTEGDENKKQTKGEEYIYREEWGENFVGSHHSVLVILDIQTGKTEVVSVDKLHNELSISEAVWGPDDKTIVFVGYKEFPRRLGVRSCINRRSAIYSFDRESKEIECISGELDISVRLPRFSPDLKTLIYLQCKEGGPHFKGSKLQKCDWQTRKITTLVDTVDAPKIGEFPGIYSNSIPRHCWFENYLFLSSEWQSFFSIICINIDNGVVEKIEPMIPSHPDGTGELFGACTVLAVRKNIILAELSSLSIEPCLAIGFIKDEGKVSIEWKYLDSSSPIKHTDIEWRVIKMNETIVNLYFEIILITPKEASDKSTAIVRPHGGPHVAYYPAFSKNIAALTKLKYVNCLVNYRGSSGFGENSINSLPGNVGVQDVAEVQQSAYWLKDDSNLGIQDFFIMGGSHGGFLSAHLIGQFSDFYKAAIILNPVIDIASMMETTDIPDWNWVEGGCGDLLDSSSVVDAQHLKLMWERSPIRYAKYVQVPVLLLLGDKDLRVPYAQGLKYYKILKARNVPVSIHVYEDCHSLSKTPHDADVFMQTVLWLQKYSS